MALLNQQQSELLTFPGFVSQFETYWHSGLTQVQAFDEVNRDVAIITGTPRYEPEKYDQFLNTYKKARKRERSICK